MRRLSNIILCGFKRCGKTTLGKKIAKVTGREFIDTDPKNARELYLENPEAFRKLEKEIIAGLKGTENGVIATGGGAVLDPENVSVLKSLGKIYYIRIEKEELKTRLLTPPLPAFFDPHDPETSFEQMYQIRHPIYESIADDQIFSLFPNLMEL